MRPLRHRGERAEVCAGPGNCENTVLAGDLCSTHYSQRQAGKELTPVRKYAPKGGPCASSCCDREAEVEGMCLTHRRYFLRNAKTWDRPIPQKAPDGSGHTGKDGYRYIQHDGKQRREHIVEFEKALGRAVRTDVGENVHHVNGNRSDNRTDGPPVVDERGRYRTGNLELWSSAQPAGQEIGPKLLWALEMLAEYGVGANAEIKSRARVVLQGMVK